MNALLMKMKKNNFLALRFIILIILILIFIFHAFIKKQDSRKSVRTAFINPKYFQTVNCIRLQDSKKGIVLIKSNGVWFVSSLYDYNSYSSKNTETAILPSDALPANAQTVDSFLKELTKIREIYQVSASPVDYDYHLNAESDDYLMVSYTAGELNNDIIFGKYDFSGINRYFKASSKTVYETDTELDSFLSVSSQFWSEPYLISHIMANTSQDSIQRLECLLNSKNEALSATLSFDMPSDIPARKILTPSSNEFEHKCSSLLELRHGDISGIPEIHDDMIPEMKVQVDFGSKQRIFMDFFRFEEKSSQTDYYIVRMKYKDNMVIYERISFWTYSKLVEILFKS